MKKSINWYNRSNVLIDVPGPSYVSLSILCGQGLLLMDYTEHNLDLHEALNER